MRKILYNRETTYTDYVFLNSIKTFLGSISASHHWWTAFIFIWMTIISFFSSDKTIRFLSSDVDAGWYDIYTSLPEDQDTYIVSREMKTSTSSTSENVLTVYKRFSYLDGVMVSNLSLIELEKMMSAKSTSWKHGMFLLDSGQNLLASQGFSSVPDFSEVDLSTLTDGFTGKR